MKKDIVPNFYQVCLAYENSEYFMSDNIGISEQDSWTKFLDECGLVHKRFNGLEVINKYKLLIAKIKYGI